MQRDTRVHRRHAGSVGVLAANQRRAELRQG